MYYVFVIGVHKKGFVPSAAVIDEKKSPQVFLRTLYATYLYNLHLSSQFTLMKGLTALEGKQAELVSTLQLF
jgi:hypothetical protein